MGLFSIFLFWADAITREGDEQSRLPRFCRIDKSGIKNPVG
jgi:hypothetical protein